MTDEEKKAIKTIKDFKDLKWYEHAFDNGTEILDEEEKQDIKIVLNLIEKQSKEIEELNKSDASKEQSSMNYYNLYKELVDKIKAKIEYKKDKLRQIQNSNDRYRIMCLQIEIDVLQSFLEKE